MSKMKISVEDKGKVIFQTGAKNSGDVAPKTKEEIESLIRKFKHNIAFLKGVAVGLDSSKKPKLNFPENPPTLLKENIATYLSPYKIHNALNFVGGLNNVEFDLGRKFEYNESYSSATVRFKVDTDIYLDKTLVLSKGGNIPFYNSIQEWVEDQYKDGVARVVLDLRPPGVYGKDMDPELLHDGEGNYGNDFNIKVRLSYDYPKH